MLRSVYERLFSKRRGRIVKRAFLSRRQFERAVLRERVRASRRGIPFCVVSIGVDSPARSAQDKAGRLILRNLRLTDEKAAIARGEFAVLLVDTHLPGGRAVIERLGNLFSAASIRVRMDLKVHDPSSFMQDDSSRDNRSGNVDPAWNNDDEETLVKCTTGDVQAAFTGASHYQRFDREHAFDRRGNEARRSGTKLPSMHALAEVGDESVSSDDPLMASSSFSEGLKRAVDIVGAMVGLILSGPALLIAMAAIRLTSPGAAIFKQTREGLRGKPFTIYKLRTMVADAERSQQALKELSHRDGPAFKIKSDPRVTSVGKFLRATCMDELPQLVNVLKGDMSLVGPRPLPWHESRACNHWHRRRLDVRPGLTCFWQINKESVETFDDWMRLDLEYVDRRNFWVDAKLIYRTFSVALLGRGSN